MIQAPTTADADPIIVTEKGTSHTILLGRRHLVSPIGTTLVEKSLDDVVGTGPSIVVSGMM